MNWGQIIYLAFIMTGLIVIDTGLSRKMLISWRERTIAAWRDLDECLAERLKRIPQMMQTIEQHARSRNEGISWYEGFAASVDRACHRAGEKINDPQERAVRENEVTQQLRALMQFTNTFPTLIANPDFREAQRGLTVISHRIIEAQRFYNHQVREYNSRLKRVHYPIIAALYKIRPMLPLKIDDASLWTDEAKDELYLHIPRA
jgi:hypothetical protein